MWESELIARARQWRSEKRAAAAAVVAQTWGSAPRRAGARLIVRDDGAFFGSVSGGCVEGEVIAAAAEVLKSGKAQTLAFGVSDETAWEAGLSCGGEIAIWLYALRPQHFRVAEEVEGALAARRGGFVVTRAADGAQQYGDGDGEAGGDFPAGIMAQARRLADESPAARIFQAEDGDGGAYFVEPFAPPPRLLLIGATHITQALLPLAAALDFAAVVIDPRRAWADAARFPAADVRAEWPDEALARLNIGARDAVITLTHDAKIDDPALQCALAAAPFYIGALGSRKTHAKRMARLRQSGIEEEALARIAAPVGLDIGAQNAAEIALSIAAEVVRALRRQ